MPWLPRWPLAPASLHNFEGLVLPGRWLIVACITASLMGTKTDAASTKATPSQRIASVIESVLPWAVEGRDLPSDAPGPSPPLPHRSCGGRLDPQNLPQTVYVAWQIFAEAQHAKCNWKYDVASRHASPLSAEEAAEVAERITAGSIGQEQRAFFHSVPMADGRLSVTFGYCWGSASGVFAFKDDRAMLFGEVTIHGY